MLLIVDYIYTGEINISEIYVNELFQLSQLLQLDRLVGFCEKFIFEQNNARLDSSTRTTDLTTDKALPVFIYKGFENEKEKTKEKSTETIYRSNKCKSCDFVGKTQRLLREHRHRFHLCKQVGATICPMCSMEFDDVDQCVEHKRMHTAKVTTNSLRFPCAVCDREYQWKWELRKHAIKHVVTKNYLCPICSRRYKREITLLKHMELHKRPTLYTKSESNEDPKLVKRRTIGPVDDSQNANLLNIDMDQLFGVAKNHACPTCGVKFHSSAKLRQHMMNHPQSMLFNCYICSFNTVEKSDIEDHLLKEHKIGELRKDIPVFVKPLMSCSTKVIKAETSSTSVSHTDHTLMGKKPHRRTGEFHCSLCDKVFKLKHILKRHILDMHSADRPFKCRVCKFDTKRRGNLKDHMWYLHKLVLSPEPKKATKSEVKNVMDTMYPIVLANDEMSVDDVVEVG